MFGRKFSANIVGNGVGGDGGNNKNNRKLYKETRLQSARQINRNHGMKERERETKTVYYQYIQRIESTRLTKTFFFCLPMNDLIHAAAYFEHIHTQTHTS